MSSTCNSESTVFEPLYVDTNIEYAIDPAHFPGMDDPLRVAEPQLLIHSESTCSCHLVVDSLYSSFDTDASSTYNQSVVEPELYVLIESFEDSDVDVLDAVLHSSLHDTSFTSAAISLSQSCTSDTSLTDQSSLDQTSEYDIFRRLCEQLDIEVEKSSKRKRRRSDTDDAYYDAKRQRRATKDDITASDDSAAMNIDDFLLSRGL